MKNWIKICSLLCVLSAFNLIALAHEGHDTLKDDSLAMSVAPDQQGQLWRASVKEGFVYVDKSRDLGQSFSAAVKVNQKPLKITAKGEARPKIALSSEGNVYLTWTEALKKPYTGYVWFARSIDGGKSFEPPYIVHQDRSEITHRFDSLNLAPDGKITVVWVDKRDLIAAKASGKKYDGAAIYYAVSNNQGQSFEPEKKLADRSCECCRIALTNKPDGTVVAMWRHVFAGSERDHAIAEIHDNQKSPTLVRASFGHWKIDGCPHHGGALAYGQGFGYHMAYFDGAGDKPSLMVSRMDGEAWVTSPPKKFGNMQHNAGHPTLFSKGNQVWLAWRESTSDQSEIHRMYSSDGGRQWTTAKRILAVKGQIDYPQLIEIKDKVYIAVNTVSEGFKLILITD
jgi:hypothetical protein